MTTASASAVRPDPESGDARPEVAVLAGRGESQALVGLAVALSRHVRLVPAVRAVDPVALLVTSPAVHQRAAAIRWPWWPPDPHRIAVVDGDEIVVGEIRVGRPSRHGVDTSAWPPLAPLPRRRWRERLKLAETLVVDTAELAHDDVPTALALASAAVVDLHHLPLALALACPTVTTAAAADAVGASDGTHLVVGGRAAAHELAADEPRCARLSRHGRRLAVEGLDADRAASQIVAAWGVAAPTTMAAVADRYLNELGTNPIGPIRHRVADAVNSFDSGPPRPADL